MERSRIRNPETPHRAKVARHLLIAWEGPAPFAGAGQDLHRRRTRGKAPRRQWARGLELLTETTTLRALPYAGSPRCQWALGLELLTETTTLRALPHAGSPRRQWALGLPASTQRTHTFPEMHASFAQNPAPSIGRSALRFSVPARFRLPCLRP